jgi:rubredoxin
MTTPIHAHCPHCRAEEDLTIDTLTPNEFDIEEVRRESSHRCRSCGLEYVVGVKWKLTPYVAEIAKL